MGVPSLLVPTSPTRGVPPPSPVGIATHRTIQPASTPAATTDEGDPGAERRLGQTWAQRRRPCALGEAGPLGARAARPAGPPPLASGRSGTSAPRGPSREIAPLPGPVAPRPLVKRRRLHRAPPRRAEVTRCASPCLGAKRRRVPPLPPPPPPRPAAAAPIDATRAAPARLAAVAAFPGRRTGASPPPAAAPWPERMERTASCWRCSVLFFRLSLTLGSSVRLGTGHRHSKPYEKDILPCKKEELRCGSGPCLMNRLPCHYKKDCGQDYVSITVTCSEIHLNQTSPISEFTHYTEASGDTSMPDSSVLVAGVVIGVVLFLSCVAIIIGTLRKKRCFQHLQRNASYTPDCFSYGSSIGEMRSSCLEELPPAFSFSSYIETLSQSEVTHPDSPPCYDECVGHGAAQIYLPTDDPPPYSLIDPCLRNELAINISWEEEVSRRTVAERGAVRLSSLQDSQRPVPSVSLSSSFPMEAAPPYESVVHEQSAPTPCAPLGGLKNPRDCYQAFFNRII